MGSWSLRFATWFEKYMYIIIPFSLIIGMVFSELFLPFISLVPYLFGFVTFVMALGCGLGHLKNVVLKPAPVLITLLLAHVLTPLIAYALGATLFGTGSDYTVGLVLFTIIPLGVSSVLWVGMSYGSVPLMLAMVVLDSALSPLVVPGLIELFFGADIKFDTARLMEDLLLIIVVPTVLGVGIYEISKGEFKAWSAPVTLPLSKIFFAAVVLLNAAAIAPHMRTLKADVVLATIAVVLLVAMCYGIGFVGSYLIRNVSREISITMSYATGMRNISLGLVLAMGYFSPQAAIPVVLGIMIQQPIATLHHALLQRFFPAQRREM
ncbi:bile acid:sodium symporter family protein [Paenibacillus sp. Marseille-Q4541]|uniref:bile acid:sodium symporter family protein n=1 Tax=Paenibacillus sp. Marseille-Q4541 TaxID=2831522 RepID=UPI001BAD6A63|nr:bile acid:sodium symporter family protein [Paenibacillus sp. Marseille-Q4541]